MGIAFSPNWGTDRWCYFYHARDSPRSNVVVRNRITRDASTGNYSAASTGELVLEGIATSGYHNRGHLVFDSQGNLLISTGDVVSAEHKHQPLFEFVNRAKLVFMFNDLPDIEDTFSTYRRVVLINFDRVFSEEEQDKDLDRKLQQPSELSGLLNLALGGLKKLREDNGFSAESWHEVRAKYQRLEDHVAAFVLEKMVLDPESEVDTDRIRQVYAGYCSEKKIPPLDNTVLGARLAAMGIENKQKRKDGRRGHVYRGIKLPDGSQATF